MAELKNIAIKDIEQNKGQIEGLPQNPRYIKDNRYKALKKSIEDAPEMLDYRRLLVIEYNNKYVTIAGNMRLLACKEIGYSEMPCYVLPKDTPPEKLREYAIKDNIGFGNDDWDILCNEWDTEELQEWGYEFPKELDGVEVDENEMSDEFSLKDGDKEPFQTMSFMVADEQATTIKNAIEEIKKTEEYKYLETFGNTNTNGNALYLIVSQQIRHEKLSKAQLEKE